MRSITVGNGWWGCEVAVFQVKNNLANMLKFNNMSFDLLYPFLVSIPVNKKKKIEWMNEQTNKWKCQYVDTKIYKDVNGRAGWPGKNSEVMLIPISRTAAE